MLALIAAVISEVSAPPLLLLQPGAWGGGGFVAGGRHRGIIDFPQPFPGSAINKNRLPDSFSVLDLVAIVIVQNLVDPPTEPSALKRCFRYKTT